MTKRKPSRPSRAKGVAGKPKSGPRRAPHRASSAKPDADQRLPLPALPALEPLEFGKSFTAPEPAEGHTILAVLRALRPGESWSKLRDKLNKSFVSLNGVVCIDEARRIASGDVIALSEKPLGLPPQPAEVRIQFVDAHIVVVEKPAGMMT